VSSAEVRWRRRTRRRTRRDGSIFCIERGRGGVKVENEETKMLPFLKIHIRLYYWITTV
jgi:hypothetical protein